MTVADGIRFSRCNPTEATLATTMLPLAQTSEAVGLMHLEFPGREALQQKLKKYRAKALL